jgi:hypothetical protein
MYKNILINAGFKQMYKNINTDAPEKEPLVQTLQKCTARFTTDILIQQQFPTYL